VFFVLLLVYSVLFIVDCALFEIFVFAVPWYIYIYIYLYWNFLFLITLQEQIDTVTVEGVENVGKEDWIEIKSEEDYVRLVGTIKTEQEVSVCVFCGSDLFTGVCACVLYCTLHLVMHSFGTLILHLLSLCVSHCACHIVRITLCVSHCAYHIVRVYQQDVSV
jgi:hypothetical protein